MWNDDYRGPGHGLSRSRTIDDYHGPGHGLLMTIMARSRSRSIDDYHGHGHGLYRYGMMPGILSDVKTALVQVSV